VSSGAADLTSLTGEARAAARLQSAERSSEKYRRTKLLQRCAYQGCAIDNLHKALRHMVAEDYTEALSAFTAANTASSSAFDNQIKGLQELQGACTLLPVLSAIILFDFAAVFGDSVQPAAEGVQSQPSLVQVHHECEKLKNRLGM